MKKILIVPSWYPSAKQPGLGTFFLEQNRLLAEDFEIRVLSGFQKRNISRLRKIYNLFKYLFKQGVSVRWKNKYFTEPPEVYGFEYECGPNSLKQLNYRILINSYLKIYNKHVNTWKPDLIHAHDTYSGGIIAKSISEKTKIPYIITEHNYLQFKYPEYIKKDFIKSIEESERMLFVSEYQVRNLLMYDVNCKPEIIGNYVDDNIFTLSGTKIKREQFSILFIGRYAYHKDFGTLIKTIIEFERINRGNDYCFTIIGVMPGKKESLLNELEGIYHGTNIRFIDYVERKDIVNFFHSSDVFLTTSIAETFGVGICEAMMCGLPVVSTNNGGFDEMYISGVNGIRTRIGDYSALAESLLKIKTGEVSFNPVAIRESVRYKYGTTAFKSRISEIYNSVNE